MSATYSGNAANVTTPIVVNGIATLDPTAGQPLGVQTAAPHGYNTGELVSISGGLAGGVNPGIYTITVGASDTFTLDGTTGTGAGTTTYGGPIPIYNVSLTPPVTRPSDGDLRSAASLRQAVDRLADYCQYLLNRAVAQPLTYSYGSSFTFVAPKTGLWEVEICGGGGGGGGGDYGGHVASQPGGSGAGGGAGSVTRILVECTIGDTITGSGGTGGTAGTGGVVAGGVNPGDGGDGGTMTLTKSAVVIGRAYGGGGGAGGLSYSAATRFAQGGLPGVPSLSKGALYTTTALTAPVARGQGGFGRGVITGTDPASDSAVQPGGRGSGAAGGAAGAQGTAGTAGGGGGGGGGGGSEWFGGTGGAGGAGGAGSATNPAPNGSAGSAGTLGGGGGGGGGGATSSNGAPVHGSGGTGGAGGAGGARFKYLGQVAV